jgi:transketolase
MNNFDFSYSELAKYIRVNSLQMTSAAKTSHIGSCLSVADLLAVCLIKGKKNESQLVFSKGHAAAAYYAGLAGINIIPEVSLKSFSKNGSNLIGHVSHHVAGIDFSSGSLGHGLPFAVGLAISNKKNKVNVILSDGELNEGTTWESLALASHHKLSNLFVIIDLNKIQSFGSTIEVLNFEPLEDKFVSFGCNVRLIDGHSIEEIHDALELVSAQSPTVIIAQTIKGKGLTKMENKLEWHYKSLSLEEIPAAIEELNNNA